MFLSIVVRNSSCLRRLLQAICKLDFLWAASGISFLKWILARAIFEIVFDVLNVLREELEFLKILIKVVHFWWFE